MLRESSFSALSRSTGRVGKWSSNRGLGWGVGACQWSSRDGQGWTALDRQLTWSDVSLLSLICGEERSELNEFPEQRCAEVGGEGWR